MEDLSSTDRKERLQSRKVAGTWKAFITVIVIRDGKNSLAEGEKAVLKVSGDLLLDNV